MGLSIANLTRRFGHTKVLQGIDLEIAEGELVALLGPSGSGKTTLLRIIAGLDWPDTGQLSLGGRDWMNLPAQARRTGFVFQHYALFAHMTVRDNIAFGLEVLPRRLRPPAAQINAKIRELLHFLQIDTLSDRYPAALSGGQRQRVALGRALAISPRLLLLDEPFGALDAQVRRDLRRWLRGVHEASGTTTIFVTHDQEEAFELADRVVVMGAGKIEQIGQPDTIYDHPASPFVARFVGLTVELPIAVHQGRPTASGMDLTALPPPAVTDGPATLFLRPTDIMLQTVTASAFHVASIASTGASLRLRVEHRDGTGLDVDLPRRQTDSFAIGQPVLLHAQAGCVFRQTAAASVPAVQPAPAAKRRLFPTFNPISAFKEQRL